MGSHLSCMSSAAGDRLPHTIKFLDSASGVLSDLEGPLTAAEAMIELPAQFLCALSSAASHGRRICAVPADQELQAGEVYLLVPMHRLNMRFTMQEMEAFAALEAARKAITHPRAAFSKGLPVAFQNKVAPFPHPSAEHALQSRSFKLEGVTYPRLQEGTMNRVMGRSKSWMPKLETVNELAVAL